MKTRIPSILIAAIAIVSQAHAHEPRLSLHEIAHAADVIVVGTVESAVAGPSKSGRSVRTTVEFRDVEVIAIGDRADAIEDRITLTFAGGSIPGGLTTSVCDQPRFEVGERWMLFALHDGLDYLNPFIGGPQGMYRIIHDRETGRPYPVRPGGGAIIRVEDGEAISTPRLSRIEHGIAFSAAPDRGVMTAPISRDGDAVTRRVETEHLPLTLDEFRAEVQRLRAAAPPNDPMLPNRDAAVAAPKLRKPAIETPVPLKPRPEATGGDRGTLCACGAHGDFAVMEQVNSGWWSFSENELGMAQWNEYYDLFRYTPDDGSWGENGDHEFGGFPSDADLQMTWGSSWGTAIAKTLMTFSSVCGTIEEADIVFNPAYSYETYIGNAIETSSILYQPVVMHELGHAWGYITNLGGCDEDYSYDYHSVMHAYYSSIFEDGRGVHVSDATLMRLHYFGFPVPMTPTDIGVESYYIDGGSLRRAFTDRDDGSDTSPTVYHQGAPITISGVTIENMGLAVNDLRLRIWLSQDLFVNAADHPFPTHFNWSSFNSEAYWTGDISATIPMSIPPGEYWVGLVVSTGGDSYDFDHIPANNTTFLTRKIIVNPPPPANDLCSNAMEIVSGTTLIDTSYAYTDGQIVGCGTSAGVNNDVWFRYVPPCDGRLTISTCGQSPTFDTSIALYRDDGMCPPNAYLGCAGQGTGCAPGEKKITYTVTEDVVYMIRVGGASPGEYGMTGLDIHLDGIVPNDFCLSPLNVSVGTYEVDNRCASTDGVADACGQMYNDLWYRIQAPCGGYLTASTCSEADFDTSISIYLGAGSCPGSILYGCSNDAPACTDGRSHAVADVSQGRFYWIRVGGDTDADRGVAMLEIRCFDDCPDVDGSGAVDFTDLNILLDNWQETVTPGMQGDVNFSGTVDFGDLNLLLDQWGDPCP